MKPRGQIITAMIKKTVWRNSKRYFNMTIWLVIIARAYNKLCNTILTKKPAAEIPVSINNFLCLPLALLLTVKNIRAAPSREKIINGDRKRRGP